MSLGSSGMEGLVISVSLATIIAGLSVLSFLTDTAEGSAVSRSDMRCEKTDWICREDGDPGANGDANLGEEGPAAAGENVNGSS